MLFRFVMSRLCNYAVMSHMSDESWRRGYMVVFMSEKIKKRREIQVKVKVNFTLKQATNLHRESRGIAVLFP